MTTDLSLPVPDLSSLASVTRQLATTAAAYDRDGTFPAEGIRTAHEAGLLTATVGERYGGPALAVAATARILHALGEGDPSVALITAMSLSIHRRQAVRAHWPQELYGQVLAEAAARPVLLNHIRVEPALGSPARGGLPATVARRTADGWSLSGHKRFATGVEGLDWLLVWATTDEPTPRVGTFVVPGTAPGIEITHRWDHLGLRASGSHDIALRDVEIPAGNVIDLAEHGAAAEQDNRAGAALHLPLAALYLGVARAAQGYFHRFAHERVPANLGHPVARTERFRRAAGEIALRLDAAEQLVFGGAERVDAADASYTPEHALGARVLADRHATEAVTLAVRLLGNPGLSHDNPLERHFRDVQCAPVHAPQEDTALLAVGAAALGTPSERKT
ncbi:acyl-CoA dehydrogenase family protein [Streptomyces violaceusniger]|uniref:acyl-CoA dehydrogenase family protein n=1 Tax=Streptomyces violaceusniger TaxID=68280 RepID=UPI0009C28503|nr:acyl-CoA dehydrogenase family protein [Streptomyces hygroscopicus]AQW48667.1 Acyl-CoA dehydrogenase type 2 domain-containingprotein [Streptomyces hygroscopicus]